MSMMPGEAHSSIDPAGSREIRWCLVALGQATWSRRLHALRHEEKVARQLDLRLQIHGGKLAVPLSRIRPPFPLSKSPHPAPKLSQPWVTNWTVSGMRTTATTSATVRRTLSVVAGYEERTRRHQSGSLSGQIHHGTANAIAPTDAPAARHPSRASSTTCRDHCRLSYVVSVEATFLETAHRWRTQSLIATAEVEKHHWIASWTSLPNFPLAQTFEDVRTNYFRL